MALRDCSEDDKKVIAEALKAAVDGPFFPEWEFHTLFGLWRAEVAEIAKTWPDVDETDSRVGAAVNNTLINLWGYPHKVDKDWSRYISVPRSSLLEVLNRWRGTKPSLDGGRRTYFDGLV